MAEPALNLTIEDNHVLAEVVGPYSRHLAEIEQALDLRIAHRGNQIVIEGALDQAGIAKAILRDLERRVIEGKGVELGDVHGAIRMNRDPAANTPKVADPRLPMHTPVEIRTRKKTIEPRSPRQELYVRALMRDSLTFGIGPAGTGKSYLAVAAAVSAFLEKRVNRIVLSRPAVEAGERLGFLPGDMKEKVDPYLRPLYDALHDMLGGDKVNKYMETGEIEVAPLAFMRGRTLSDAFIVLDEAQNCTRMQMKMFLTRLGEHAQMVVTGDPTQVDLPRGERSGLEEAVQILDGVKGVSLVRFDEQDVVRHPLVTRIVRAYDALDAGAGRSNGR